MYLMNKVRYLQNPEPTFITDISPNCQYEWERNLDPKKLIQGNNGFRIKGEPHALQHAFQIVPAA